jgi:hypothetical protein
MLRAADDRADFLGEVVDVLAVREQLVVLGVGEQLRAQVLVVLEDQSGADTVDVETALLDGRQFRLKFVVVERLRPGDVNLEIDWDRPRRPCRE